MKTFLIILSVLYMTTALFAEPITVNDAIIDKMFHDYNLDKESYEIEILSNRLKLKELSGVGLSFKQITLKEPIGLFSVIVTIFKNENKIESSQVRMRIKKFGSVLVSSDRLKRHSHLSESNTLIKRVEITNLRSKSILTLDETKGYRMKGSAQKSVPITSSMLEKIPDIVSGRETTIVYVGSVFKISADGVAMQSGSKGDFIKVKNKTSKKIIVARVIDSHHVAVDP